jgi:histidinol phosphatase-like PHP family hydrolase
MIYEEPVYDLDELARCNLHVHTHYSGCAKPEMVIPAIIKKAEEAGLSMIALTDHYNFFDFDKDYLRQIEVLKNYAAWSKTGLKVLYSSELSAYAPGKQLESFETNRALDYRLYSCNHYHLSFWGHPEEKTARGYAVYSMQIISELAVSGRADCIAHPLIGRFVKCCDDGTEVTRAITDEELFDLSVLLRENHVAWEINVGAFLGDPAFGRRLWHIGKEAGTTFHFGTDAHRLDAIDTKTHLGELKKILL